MILFFSYLFHGRQSYATRKLWKQQANVIVWWFIELNNPWRPERLLKLPLQGKSGSEYISSYYTPTLWTKFATLNRPRSTLSIISWRPVVLLNLPLKFNGGRSQGVCLSVPSHYYPIKNIVNELFKNKNITFLNINWGKLSSQGIKRTIAGSNKMSGYPMCFEFRAPIL